MAQTSALNDTKINTSRKPAYNENANAKGIEDSLASGERTDLTRWRMRAVDGRQTWHYLSNDEELEQWPQTYADKWYLGLPTNLPTLPRPKKPLESVQNGLSFFSHLQLPPGNWGCEFGGPQFLLGGVVISWYLTQTPIPIPYRLEIAYHLFSIANSDGGWGLHTEAESSVLGTAFNYATLRIIGVGAEDARMVKARATLHRLGGATHAPHWTKFWLACMGVVKWEAVNPCPPEAWLLPDWVPFHPWRWWVHIKYVYLAMSWFYSKRWVCEETELIRELKKEMFVENWEEIDWWKARNEIAEIDNFRPKSRLLNTANWVMVNLWQPWLRPEWVKRRAEEWVEELIDMESENTDFLCLAPANGAMNMVVHYASKGPDSYEFRRAREALEENLWVSKNGMFCNGTNGIQCWDTAFTVQAVIEAGVAEEERWRPMLVKALEFLDAQQMREEVPRQYGEYRHPRKGGWAFSNRHQGYPVSDCVSEGLKAVIMVQRLPGIPQLLDDRRIFDAVDTLLTYQNATGGCGSYEATRGPKWVELLNAAEIFENIMVEYDYTECTTACITALALFREHWPEYRKDDIRGFIERAVVWIKTQQFPHGGWYGNWGICFTYGTMFALESLHLVGETYANSEYSKRGCEFLIERQRNDGGWSESYRSCEKHEYIEHPSGSQVVMTAWALIGLLNAEYPHIEPLRRGVKLIMDRQQDNGEWKQEAIEGVFNKSTMCSYPNYKFHFVIKALGMFAQRYPEESVI